MHKNHLWLAFLSTVLLAVVWYTYSATNEFKTYFALQSKTNPKKIEWIVEADSNNKFYLKGKYFFVANNKTYTGETLFPSSRPNTDEYSNDLKSIYQKKNWTIWYSQKDPIHSSLTNPFPLKALLYSLVLWGLLIYFLWLGIYVGKMTQ